jgi:alanine racemase
MHKDAIGLRTWVEIDRRAIRHNFLALKKNVKSGTKFMAVVKSNAYGHGMLAYAKELDKHGVDWFGVDELAEGLLLRKVGIKKPILVLGFTPPYAYVSAAKANVCITISNQVTLDKLTNYKGPPLAVHIKIDSGLHRQGFIFVDIEKVISTLLKFSKTVKVDGLYTHFATAESPKSPYALKQINQFNFWINQFTKAGFSPITHAAGTAATVLLPETHFDMVRVGIGLYGLWPSADVKQLSSKHIALKPVLSWKAIVGDVKSLKKGDRVGYDLTETVVRNSRVAVCGVGYWHGFSRSLSSKGVVGVRGQKAKVLGRVSMDMIVLDVTHIPHVETGDEVALIGNAGNNNFPAEALAEAAGTINYEIVTRINPLIPRIFV